MEKNKIKLTAENLYLVKKYLYRPEWIVDDGQYKYYELEEVDFQKGYFIGKHYDEVTEKLSLDNIYLVGSDQVLLQYKLLLEKIPKELREELIEVVEYLEQYAAVRGYNGCV